MKHKFFILFLSLLLVFSFVAFAFADTYTYFFDYTLVPNGVYYIDFIYNGVSYSKITHLFNQTIRFEPSDNSLPSVTVFTKASGLMIDSPIYVSTLDPVSYPFFILYPSISFLIHQFGSVFDFVINLISSTVDLIVSYPVILLWVFLPIALIGVGFFKRFIDL